MYKVPNHIKAHVRRIIREYEILLEQGHKITLQLFRDNRIYSGVETTEYYLKSVRHFLKLLETQDEYLEAQTEEEFQKKVYKKICEFYKPLSEIAVLRITNSVECQGQLKEALQDVKKISCFHSDARSISVFISHADVRNWCLEDQAVHNKIFKLVRTEEEFEKLLNCQGKSSTVEITQAGINPCIYFRMALQVMDIEDCYRKKNRIREYRNFWNSCHNIEEFDTDYKIFNMWNNITETGIFYVYIPGT